MAIKIYEQFAPFANPADGDHPYGSIKNDSIPGAEDGTPLDAVWGNDLVGFTDALLAEAGIAPSGNPDKLGASQRVDALKQLTHGLSYGGIRAFTGSADKLRCYGRTNVFDRAQGFFCLDPLDIASADDDGTVLVDSLGRRWKRQIDSYALLEWWGGGVDVPDNLSAWNTFAAHETINKLSLFSGEYIFSNTVKTVEGKYKLIEGEGVWNTLLRVNGTGNGVEIYETGWWKNLQIRRTKLDGTVDSPGVGTGVGIGLKTSTTLASAYTRLEQVFVFGHFAEGFNISCVSGNFVNCNSYNVKGDGWVITGGSNTFEKCWSENNNGRAFDIQGINNQFFQCYEENTCLTQPTLPQVRIGGSAPGTGKLTVMTNFDYNPRNALPLIPVFEINEALVYVSANEEVTVDPNKVVCHFGIYAQGSVYDGVGLITGGVSGGYPAFYNPFRANIKGNTTPTGGISKIDDSNKITVKQAITFTSLGQSYFGIPSAMSPDSANMLYKESSNGWDLRYEGSNVNLLSWRLTVLNTSARISLKWRNQGFTSPNLVLTDGTQTVWSGGDDELAPFGSVNTLTDSYIGLILTNEASSIASCTAILELTYRLS